MGQDKDGEPSIDARIVCVRNRNNRKDWLAILCTNMALSEQDIIRIYGHRWDIEVFFKTCKSSLRLRREYHGLSYDGLIAHVAMVFTRYRLLAVAWRDNKDERTIGGLFYLMVEEVADITFSYSMQILVEAMLETVQETFHVTDEQVERFSTSAFFLSCRHLCRDYCKPLDEFCPLRYAVFKELWIFCMWEV